MISSTAMLETISLEELMQSASLQSRIDTKYLVPSIRINELPHLLPAGTRVLKIDDQTTSRYFSVYFDTPDHFFYSMSATSRRRRIKVRTRAYVDSDLAFLEIKTKGLRGVTEKTRIPHRVEQMWELDEKDLDFIRVSLMSQGVDPSLAQTLRPKLTTSYDRSTFVVPERDGQHSRVTADSNLEWTLLAAVPGSAPANPKLLCAGMAIVETKSIHLSSSANRALWSSGLRECRISKYCTGFAALDPRLPANRWHRALTEISRTRKPIR